MSDESSLLKFPVWTDATVVAVGKMPPVDWDVLRGLDGVEIKGRWTVDGEAWVPGTPQ